MKKIISRVLALFIVAALTCSLVACQQEGEAPSGDPTETPSPTETLSPTESVVMIPAQTITDNEYVEYRFTGSFDTVVMGYADAVAELYFDGSYEIILRLGAAFSTTPSWGEWSYDEQADKFILTDTDNDIHLETVKDGNVYTIVFDNDGTPIELTAELTETKELSKLHDGPKRDMSGDDGPQGEERTVWVSIEGIDATDGKNLKDGFFFRMYSDNTIDIYLSQAGSEYSSGTWSYSAENGLELVVDGNEIDVALNGDYYEYVAAAEVAPGMAFGRKYVISKTELEACIANKGPVLESVAAGEIQDRYASYTDEQWDALWREDNGVIYTDQYDAVQRTSNLDTIFENILPKEYFAPVAPEARGTVQKFNYKTYIYDYYQTNNVPESEWTAVSKSCYVYIPAGYSDGEKYNVYYLMHGAGGNAENWFSMNCDGSSAGVGEGDFVALLDYLIANRLMEPTIFVSATISTDTSSFDRKIQNTYGADNEIASFAYELENDLIPAVEGIFSTYAENTSHDALVASRDHRAFAGLSLGAYVTWHIMEKTFDVMSYYAPLANGYSSGSVEDNIKESPEFAAVMQQYTDFDMGFLFAFTGDKDHTYPFEWSTYDALIDGWDELVYGENTVAYRPENGTHSAKYFILGVYDSMKVFFKR